MTKRPKAPKRRAAPKKKSPAALLTGHAIAAQVVSQWDHTYVRSGTRAWGCFGRSTGGDLLVRGRGSLTRADCLAGADGKAGIVYGSTGVCHQAANRILYPAQVTVCRARGFRASAFLYGVYGRELWPQLEECISRGLR
jgi:hypothetical protein